MLKYLIVKDNGKGEILMPRIASLAGAAVALVFSGLSAAAVESTYTATSTATPEAVWKKIGDFCGIATWHPAVEKCVLSDDGKMRTLSLKGGGTIVETLVNRDDNAHSYTYQIVSSPLPVSDYVSTIKVLPEGAGSSIVWTGNYKAKGASDTDAKSTIDGIYKAGVDAIAK
jgi:Polyketide cyclase / dehydrase and lipid transport